MTPAVLEQQSLDLGLPPGATVTLREAYDCTPLALQGISFEEACAKAHIRIPLERVAASISKARRAK